MVLALDARTGEELAFGHDTIMPILRHFTGVFAWVYSRRVALVLVVIMVGGAFLRFYGITAKSLWNDELSSWWRSGLPSLREVVQLGAAPDVHPPGYYVLLHLWMDLFGDSELALRSLGAVCGTLSIPVLFLIGKRLYGNLEALLTALLYAGYPPDIFYSQQVRAYAPLALATLGSSYALIRLIDGLRSRGRLRLEWAVGFVLGGGATAYLHYFGLLAVACQALFAWVVLLRRPRLWPRLVLVFGCVAGLYVPWFTGTWEDFANSKSWIHKPTASTFADLASFAFGYSDISAACCLTVIVVGTFAGRRSSSRPRTKTNRFWSPSLLVTAWVIVPTAVAYVQSVVGTPTLSNRNLLICWPALTILLAVSAARIGGAPWRSTVIAGAAVAVMLGNFIVEIGFYSAPSREDFRGLAQEVHRRSSNLERPFVIGHNHFPQSLEYYFRQIGSPLRVDMHAGKHRDLRRVQRALEKRKPAHFWVIAAHKMPQQGFLRALRKQHKLVEHVRLRRAEAWLFRRSNGGKP